MPPAKTVLFILYPVVKSKLHFNKPSVFKQMKTCPERRYLYDSAIIIMVLFRQNETFQIRSFPIQSSEIIRVGG